MTVSDIAQPAASRWRLPGGLLGTALRYGVSASGPAAVSGAHFVASLIFLRNLSAHEFGLFSFVMVVVAFGMSLNVSLISVPLTRNLAIGDLTTGPICFQMNWLVCAGFAVSLFAALLVGGALRREAMVFALFAGIFTFRWFARCVAYVDGRVGAAIRSDLTYSLFMIGSLSILAASHHATFSLGADVLLLSAVLALLPFGLSFFRAQVAALRGDPSRYWPIFRDVTRWSLTGVILTELTVNAHVYLVTFISGPGAFALLALGMLLMRPASLMQSALPDLERPAMARAIAANDPAALSRIQRHFTWGLAAAWTANILLCAALLAFLPALLVKKSYGMENVIIVASICGLIVVIRALRTPLAVLMQAAGEFKELAGIGVTSALVSLAATLGLLLAFGPIASLGGIVLGELVILAQCRSCARSWKRAHVGDGI